MESLVTELARVTSRERSLTENCGVALLKTQASLVQNLSFTVLHISSSFVFFALYKRCIKDLLFMFCRLKNVL